MFHLYAFATLLLSHTVVPAAHANIFNIANRFQGPDFLAWEWQTFDDPTHGRVNYVDRDTAIRNNLSSVSADGQKFFMRADAYQIVPDDHPRGRDSVRIGSPASYDEAVLILDLAHMPEGCGTWPAFWTLSKAGPWPNGGEIDIIEGVNTNTQNLATLHSTPGCNMTDSRPQSGRSVSSDCNAAVNYNQGCGVAFPEANSYGSAFNKNGGGYYAMAKTRASGVSVWFWPRDCSTVPDAVRNFPGSDTIDISTWPQPDAYFPSTTCDHSTHFDAHTMTFDLTFCGDWAGSAFGTAGCGVSSCESYVNNNPSAFSEAYWEINSLRAYTLVTGLANLLPPI